MGRWGAWSLLSGSRLSSTGTLGCGSVAARGCGGREDFFFLGAPRLMDPFDYIVSQPFPILLWAGLARGQGWRGRREQGNVDLGTPAEHRVWPVLRTL